MDQLANVQRANLEILSPEVHVQSTNVHLNGLVNPLKSVSTVAANINAMALFVGLERTAILTLVVVSVNNISLEILTTFVCRQL